MISEELNKRFHKPEFEDDYLEFDRIPDSEKLHENSIICGILKVYSLLKKPERFDIYAGHDIVWLSPTDNLKQMTDDDIVYLRRCGVIFDSDSGGLAINC